MSIDTIMPGANKASNILYILFFIISLLPEGTDLNNSSARKNKTKIVNIDIKILNNFDTSHTSHPVQEEILPTMRG